MSVLFIFLDGVGLGGSDPEINPFARAEMPVLRALLGGRPLTAEAAPWEGPRASLLALDANLGVNGLPQSATGQAVLLTGRNVPDEIGYHYGPKPNPEVAERLRNGNLFSRVLALGRRTALLSAYPPRYFEAIRTGRRIYSAIPQAAVNAGLDLMNQENLAAGQALAADFTGQGWHDFLGLRDIPVLTPAQAGTRLAALANTLDLAFFEYWLSDYAGHQQDMSAACRILNEIDQVLGALLQTWNDQSGLVLVTSDHGNLEDLSTRRHTANPVPALLIGGLELRRQFGRRLADLTGIYPAVLRTIEAGAGAA